jgi:hypothetical protein
MEEILAEMEDSVLSGPSTSQDVTGHNLTFPVGVSEAEVDKFIVNFRGPSH